MIELEPIAITSNSTANDQSLCGKNGAMAQEAEVLRHIISKNLLRKQYRRYFFPE
jgi:hypothetical protein